MYMCADPTASASQAEKEEVDSRSIYVGNVRFITFTSTYKFASPYVTGFS